MARRLTGLGGEIRCSAEVVGVDVADGRATGVRTADGERHEARRAVVADVTAPVLFGRLVDAGRPPGPCGPRHALASPSTRRPSRSTGLSTRRSPGLRTPPLQPGTVHVADSVVDITEAMGQVTAGAVPDRPFLLMGQMTTTDPTRSPDGTESAVGVHARAPGHRCSTTASASASPTSMQARIERLAPGFGSRVLARRVLGPRELEAPERQPGRRRDQRRHRQLHQQLVFRPVPGLGRAETGIAGLYLGSASAHPGGGVHGACGANAARAAVLHHRLRPDRMRWPLPGHVET